jgi:hypothetical protein
MFAMKFRICVKGSLAECLAELDDRGLIPFGIAQSTCLGQWLFDLECEKRDLQDWLSEVVGVSGWSMPIGSLLLANEWHGDTVALPAIGELCLTEYECSYEACSEDNECPDRVLVAEIVHEFDTLGELVKYICDYSIESSGGILGSGHDVSSYSLNGSWFVGQEYADYGTGEHSQSDYHVLVRGTDLRSTATYNIIAYLYTVEIERRRTDRRDEWLAVA